MQKQSFAHTFWGSLLVATLAGVLVWLLTTRLWGTPSQPAPQSAFFPSDYLGEWYDRGPYCLRITKPGFEITNLAVKMWYCEAGEPASAIAVSFGIDGLQSKDGRTHLRLLEDDKLLVIRGLLGNEQFGMRDLIFEKVGNRKGDY